LPLVVVDQWQLRWFLRGKYGHDGGALKTGHAAKAKTGHAMKAKTGNTIPGFMDLGGGVEGSDDGGFDHNVLQRVVRVRGEDGCETIHATLRAEFVAGQRQATLHFGFCPPLARLPVIEVETVDGPEAELKVGAAYCHGARVEVRLSEPAEESCSVLVEMVAAPQLEDEEMGRE
jgi:hypothetical protein